LLGCIEPRTFGLNRALGCLAIHDSSRGFAQPTLHLANGVAQSVVYDLKITSFGPSCVGVVDGVPGWKVVRQHAPCASRTNTIKDRVHDFASIMDRPLEVRKLDRRWYQVLKYGPLRVRQVARIRPAKPGRCGARRHANGRSQGPVASKFEAFSVEHPLIAKLGSVEIAKSPSARTRASSAELIHGRES